MKCRTKYCIAIFITILVLTLAMLGYKAYLIKTKKKSPSYRTWGYRTAPIKIEVFSDLECPACSNIHKELNDLKEKYPGKFTITFKHFPLKMHKWSFYAAVAAECAGEQNSFNDYIDELYANQADWYNLGDVAAYLISTAENLVLDMPKFYKCLSSEQTYKKVQSDFDEALKRNVPATPSFFIKKSEVMNFRKFRRELSKRIKEYEYRKTEK
ncbi:MAG TPA: thioredoxin domain-containing protein [Elusimicrobiales bacterium]|nr:thioredoxin domain-containing protein [Elusimicrobiales bacterium]